MSIEVPTNSTKNDGGFGLPPFEDRWSCWHGFFSLPAHGSTKLQHYRHIGQPDGRTRFKTKDASGFT
jgi:hypothetical protein